MKMTPLIMLNGCTIMVILTILLLGRQSGIFSAIGPNCVMRIGICQECPTLYLASISYPILHCPCHEWQKGQAFGLQAIQKYGLHAMYTGLVFVYVFSVVFPCSFEGHLLFSGFAIKLYMCL